MFPQFESVKLAKHPQWKICHVHVNLHRNVKRHIEVPKSLGEIFSEIFRLTFFDNFTRIFRRIILRMMFHYPSKFCVLPIGPLETNFAEILIEIWFIFLWRKWILQCFLQNGSHVVWATYLPTSRTFFAPIILQIICSSCSCSGSPTIMPWGCCSLACTNKSKRYAIKTMENVSLSDAVWSHCNYTVAKASDAELWCFLWSVPEPTIEQTPVIWYAIAPIMTSLQW